jgi:hypothetical protein
VSDPTEKAIVLRILKFLNSIPGCVARKRWGGVMGVAGDPDVTGCLRGRHLELEVKRPGQRPTPLQAKRLEEWKQAGAVTAVVTSVEEVRRALEAEQLP